MNQENLFGKTPYPLNMPGSTDKQTSLAAARKVKATLANRQLNVLWNMFRLGPCTADQLCRFMKSVHNHVAPRVTELKHLNLVEDTGHRRKTRQGSSAKVLQLTKLGKDALK